ncbi:MAG: hypothetical protein Q9204_005760 [Flavoplaca sp. TL-2023a]
MILSIAVLGLGLAIHNLLHFGSTSKPVPPPHLDIPSPAQDHFRDTIPRFHTPSHSLPGSDQAARDAIAELEGLNSKQDYLGDFTTHSGRLSLLLKKIEARWGDVGQVWHTLKPTLEPLHNTQSIHLTRFKPAEMKDFWNFQQQISKLLDSRPSNSDLAKAIVAEQDALSGLIVLIGRDFPKEHASIVRDAQEELRRDQSMDLMRMETMESLETDLRRILYGLAELQAQNMEN